MKEKNLLLLRYLHCTALQPEWVPCRVQYGTDDAFLQAQGGSWLLFGKFLRHYSYTFCIVNQVRGSSKWIVKERKDSKVLGAIEAMHSWHCLWLWPQSILKQNKTAFSIQLSNSFLSLRFLLLVFPLLLLHTGLSQKTRLLPVLRSATRWSVTSLLCRSALWPILPFRLLSWLKLPYSSTGWEAGNGVRYPREFCLGRKANTRLCACSPHPFLLAKNYFKSKVDNKEEEWLLSLLVNCTRSHLNNLRIWLFCIRMCDSDLWKYVLPRRRPHYGFYTQCQWLPSSVYLPSYLSALHIFASVMDWRSC